MSAFTEANRKAFNDLSSEYNSKPWQQKLSSQVSDALQSRKEWLGVNWAEQGQDREVKLLDYACGTGSITNALWSYVTVIRGIDISENMVDNYNEAARSSGLTAEQANAVVGDLLAETVPNELSGPEYHEFDVAAIGLGFHHFEDPNLAFKRLAERLKPETGVLIIIDFLPNKEGHHAHKHDMSHTIKHNGFDRAAMQKLYLENGFEEFAMTVLEQPAVMEMKDCTVERSIFIAKGQRAPTAWGKIKRWANNGLDKMGEQSQGQLGQGQGNGTRWDGHSK